jgi:hypothetical protein
MKVLGKHLKFTKRRDFKIYNSILRTLGFEKKNN